MQYGPRQGVYTFDSFHIRPHSQQLWQWSQVHHSVKWRQSQFKNPEDSYNYRSRIETQNVPQPVAQAPPRSRPHSATDTRHLSTKNGCSHLPQQSLSSVSLISNKSATNRRPSRPSSGQPNHRSSGSQNGTGIVRTRKQAWTTPSPVSGPTPQFSLTAQAVTIQPRSPKKWFPSHSQDDTSQSPFPYPDPLNITGNPSFEDRLAELAQLECDTIRHEEAIRRYSTPHLTRPSSARSIRSATPKVRVQSVQRVSKATVSSRAREQSVQSATAARRHRSSLPTTLRPSSTRGARAPLRSTSNTAAANTGKDTLNSTTESVVPDATNIMSVDAPTQEQSIEKQVPSTCTRQSSQPTPLSEEDNALSCSPPIVYVSSLPNYKPKITHSHSVLEIHVPPQKEVCLQVTDITTTQLEETVSDSGSQVLDDDLQVTSDLGLSIDSLHLIDTDDSTQIGNGRTTNSNTSDPDEQLLLVCDSQDGNSALHSVDTTCTCTSTHSCELKSTVCRSESETLVKSHTSKPRKGSAGKRTSSTSAASSNSRNTKSQKRHRKNGLKKKTFQNKN